MTSRDIPNIITVFRILLIVPVIGAIMAEAWVWAVVLFLVAGISDGIDGMLARRFGWHSPLGAILDPVADKLLMVSLYVVLGLIGFIPVWLAALVVVRDAIIVASSLAYYRRFQGLEVEPTVISKLNTFLQIALVIVALLALGVGLLPAWLVDSLVLVVLASTLLSGLNYAWVWGWRAWRNQQEHG